jgi:hypothetical protein
VRFGVVSRTQGNVYAPYKTMAVYGDGAIYYNKDKSDFIGIGGNFTSHDEGNKMFKQTQVNIGLSYSKFLTSNNDILTIGFQAGITQKITNIIGKELHWDSQWNSVKNNWESSYGEYYNTSNINYYDYSAGILYNRKINSRIKVAGGFSIYHINRPSLINNLPNSFGPSPIGNRPDILQRRFNYHVSSEIYTGDNATSLLVPTFVFSNMLTQKYVLMGLDWKTIFSDDSKTTNYLKQKSISFGLFYRWRDALIPHARIEYKDLILYLAYDITISRLSAANKSLGAYEFSLQYQFKTKSSSKNRPRIYKYI